MSWLRKAARAIGVRTEHPDWRASLARQLDEIEAEMRRIGYWQDAPIEPERMQFRQAFGIDTMAFGQWLQFVFLPNARATLAPGRTPPERSMVAAQAVREFDGCDEAQGLCSLLSAFDASVVAREPVA